MLKKSLFNVLPIIAALFAMIGSIAGQNNSPRQNQLREQFQAEASRYRMSVLYLMQVHDPNLLVGGSQAYRPPVNEEDWQQLRSDLAALDTLCRTKFAGITNRQRNDTNIDDMPATWCEIAARRAEYEVRGRSMAASDQFGPQIRVMVGQVQQAIDNPNEFINEEIQLLMYERDKWRAQKNAKFQKNFAALGVQMPLDFYAEVERKGDELVKLNERIAPTRSFLMPKQRDTTIETFLRGRYATQKKGVQILKIGLDDAVWQIHRNALGIPLSQTKVARLLVRVPNRPFCQEHSVAVERKYTGRALGALTVEGNVGSEGLLMRCE